MENNAAVRIWSKKTKQEKGDNLKKGYMSELWDFTRINMDKHLFRALDQYWNPTYSCFTFGKLKKLILECQHPDILKEANEHRPGSSKKEIVKKRVDVFALSIYGLVIFSKVLGYIDERVKEDLSDVHNACYLGFIATFGNLRDEDVEWRAPWMIPNEILYRCEDFD
ncbi:hypothetical protein Goshw_018338 [Gossypium schwendimanii]|uniref:Aminotransferase-like plant mobile domain-containing protein n=1 Tax=Gossypium schwendimanii TaxID=34291 RepID=A0A7J9L3Z5_GOSSC|nr:hypothetical protein [Gossypium schwendimanii]